MTARPCRSRPLTDRDIYGIIAAVAYGIEIRDDGIAAIPYAAIAGRYSLRDAECVTHIAGGLPPKGCSGSCLVQRAAA